MKRNLSFILLMSIAISGFAQYAPTTVVSQFKQYQNQFGLTNADIEGMIITDQYTDDHSGITHIYMRQVVNGIEVFNGNASMHLDKSGNIISCYSDFVKDAKQLVTSTKPSVGVTTALQSAAQHVEMNIKPALSKTDGQLVNNKNILVDKTVSEEPIQTGLYYYYTNQQLVLSYNVELFNNETSDWWNVRVNADNGVVIDKNNWTSHCSFEPNMYSNETELSTQQFVVANKATAAGYAKKSDLAGKYLVVPFPGESPNHAPRQYVLGDAANLNASPFGWHDTNGVAGPEMTTTRGNNVFADEDTLSSNGNGFSPNGGDSLVFDFPMDTAWLDYDYFLPAAITNLFYANNFVHDVLYQYGFNEKSGNFQFNNYGKGGAGRDQVQAEAQDGSGTGNANFSTPADGSSGRMQMYLWPVGSVATPPVVISAPSTAAGNYPATLSAFGSKRFADITADVVLVDDGSSADSLGCGTLVNSVDLTGKIALIYRGTCSVTSKVLNAQNAGAIAVIMIHNTGSTPTQMTGSNSNIVIPSVIISQAYGALIKKALDIDSTVTATIKGMPLQKSYDSDFDNGVIAHEFGHGVSTRLTGGPSNSNCLNNGEQAGEGWSDFFALAFTAKEGDKGTDAKGIGTFVYNQATNGAGIRDYKYTTNMTTNPMTYNYIKNDRGVHYVGTVWCSMLWDMYWNLVAKYGFDPDVYNGTGGNNMAIQLVIDGLKLQPCSPGFVDARNAIIKADSILNGGANRALLWNTFARRGLGYTASQGSNTSVTDGTAKFDLPPDVTGVSDAENLGAYITMMPNPASDKAVIVMPDQLRSAQVLITDITGKTVLNEELKTNSNQHLELNLTTVENGLYFVKVTNGGTVFQSKLLIHK